jgi:hypothetical protein
MAYETNTSGLMSQFQVALSRVRHTMISYLQTIMPCLRIGESISMPLEETLCQP